MTGCAASYPAPGPREGEGDGVYRVLWRQSGSSIVDGSGFCGAARVCPYNSGVTGNVPDDHVDTCSCGSPAG